MNKKHGNNTLCLSVSLDPCSGTLSSSHDMTTAILKSDYL